MLAHSLSNPGHATQFAAQRFLASEVKTAARPKPYASAPAAGRSLVRWQYGLGRAAVFTSDAKNRWAVNWVTWPGFDRLWANIFRDILPHAPQTETAADFDRASNELVVDYRLSRNAGPEPVQVPDIFVFGPNGFQAPLKVGKVAAGHYRGRLAIGQNQGLFRVRPLADRGPSPRWVSIARKTRCGSTATTNRYYARLPRPPAAVSTPRRARSSTPAAAASARPWNYGPACWRWPSC